MLPFILDVIFLMAIAIGIGALGAFAFMCWFPGSSETWFAK